MASSGNERDGGAKEEIEAVNQRVRDADLHHMPVFSHHAEGLALRRLWKAASSASNRSKGRPMTLVKEPETDSTSTSPCS